MMRIWTCLAAGLLACAAQDAVDLFNGRDLSGWMWSVEANPPSPSWEAGGGTLHTTPGKGTQVYLLTRGSFSDFQLDFEWKAEPGANSGIKYRFQGYWVDGKLAREPGGKTRIEPVALEYQIIDDRSHPDALTDARHTTAALYEYWPAKKDAAPEMNVWHTGRIVARGLHIEHWLDGRRVLSIELDDGEVQASFAASSRKGSSPVLAKQERRESPIALQYHDGGVWFRNLRVKRL
jgi:hypothetical protein